MKRLFFILFVSLFIINARDSLAHPAFELYQEAVQDIKTNNVKDIRNKLQQVVLMYPGSAISMKAQMMSAFVSYANKNYVMAELDAESYIRRYPRSSELDYMHYLLGMSCYERIDIVDRDSSSAIKALVAFDWIIQNSPQSKYATLARDKSHNLIEYLAAKEMNVGRFYMTQANYVPAIKRFAGVIKNYKDTRYVPEAMYRLSEIFTSLNITTEAKYYRKKLIRDYPDSTYSHKAGYQK